MTIQDINITTMGDAGEENTLYPPRTPLTADQLNTALSACLAIQETGQVVHSKRPFGSVLLGPDNTTILLSHLSISHIRHSETQLARLAADHYSSSFLWRCTLVSTWEPCAMCAGTLYWSNIGRLVYAAAEVDLRKLTGENNPENVTFDMPCREVLSRGQKDIEIIGPVVEGGWADKVIELSDRYWAPVRARGRLVVRGTDLESKEADASVTAVADILTGESC